METTTGWMSKQLTQLDFRTVPEGSFRVSSPPKKSKTLEFFDDLYTYPPKFRVKWDTIDELHEDLFTSYNYRLINNNFSFLEALNSFFNTGETVPVKKTSYVWNSYVEGYLNKITSTGFYNKQSKQFQQSLQTVPVYTILNGQGEIVLATSTDTISSQTASINKIAYDFCGSFDPFTERGKQLGLFFLSRHDAEIYLNEIAKFDTQGTKMLGLSIHCFGLDFAYRVTREYHPNIDFRFIPDLEELQALLTAKNTGDSSLLFSDGQQQLRWRHRSVNVIPVFQTLNKRVLPFSSFLEKNEYFKGVPIYVVKFNGVPVNFLAKRYYGAIGLIDKFYSRFLNCVNTGFGFGNSWILQGPINDQEPISDTQTYVFFERSQATYFCKRYTDQLVRYSGSRSVLFDPFAKRPKILVHNLEDFLEVWEESLSTQQPLKIVTNENSNHNFTTIKFIPSNQAANDLDIYSKQSSKPVLQNLVQFVAFKYRRLSGFMEILLNTN